MDISSNLNSALQTDILKKAMDVQARDVLSVLESSAKQTQQAQQIQPPQDSQSISAQLTGLGNNLDIKV